MPHTGSGGVSVGSGPSVRIGTRAAGRTRAGRRVLARTGRRAPPEPPPEGAAWACSACGRLHWPDARADVHPHRSDAFVQPPRCDHCGERSWLRLGETQTALALATAPSRDRFAVATRAVVGGAVGGIAAAFLAVPAVSAVAIALGFAAVAGLVTARQRRMSEPAPTCLPARWSFAPPPEGPIERIVEGLIDPLGELLQAPLSGRPCVAYELGVRRDRSAGAPLDSWLLLEHRIAPATVAGEPLEILPHLRLDREPPIDADARDLAPAAVDFLRRRGIVLEGDPLLLFETVVLPGAHVRLEHRDDGTVLAPGTERRALAASSPTPPS